MSVVRIVQQRLEIPHAVGELHDLFLQEAGVSARGAAAVLRRREDVHGTRNMRSAGGVESRGRGVVVHGNTGMMAVSHSAGKACANPCLSCLTNQRSVIFREEEEAAQGGGK